MSRSLSISFLIAMVIVAVGCGGNSGSGSRIDSSSGSGNGASSGPALAVSITPSQETLRVEGQRGFSGWDSSVGQYDVTWSLQEGAAAGTITADGLYTAPGTPGTFHVIATSSHDNKLSASASLAIVNVGFVSIGDMAISRSGHTATLLSDGRVLVAGGTNDAIHSAEIFIPGSSNFVPISGSMVHPRSGHCASTLPDGRVLIVGGDDANSNLLTSAEVFDPVTQTFTPTGNLNQARKGATATLLSNGKVLIAGGQGNGGKPLSSAEQYDPVNGAFSLTGPMQTPRAQHTATLLQNGKVLLVGSNDDSTSAELFDPATGLFTATGSMGQARTHHTATLLLSGKVLILGGTQVMPPKGGGAAAAPVSLASAEIYDPEKGSFEGGGKLLVARDFHSATLLPNGTVLVAGGYSHGFDGDAQPEWNSMFVAELFNPITSVSTAAASLEDSHAEHAATMLNNGQVLVTGGIAGFQELCCVSKPRIVPLAAAELYK